MCFLSGIWSIVESKKVVMNLHFQETQEQVPSLAQSSMNTDRPRDDKKHHTNIKPDTKITQRGKDFKQTVAIKH